MKSKILCLILVSAVVCSAFVISASAQEEYFISAGSYRFNDLITEHPTSAASADYSVSFDFYITLDIQGVEHLVECSRLKVTPGSIQFDIDNITPSIPGWDTPIPAYVIYIFEDNQFYDEHGWTLSYFDQVITLPNDVYTNSLFGSWFTSNTVPFSSELTSGSYKPTGRSPSISELSWLNSGETVYFDVNGYVIQDFLSGTTFDQLGFTFIATSDTSYALSIIAVSEGVPLGSIFTFYNNGLSTSVDYDYINFSDVSGIHINHTVDVSSNISNLYATLFDEFEQVYTGNVWYDIIDGVVDALKVDVFGSFSPWDILTTFIGLAVFLWLLKALAGG